MGIYLTIMKDDKEIWQSGWYENRELYEDSLITDLKNGLKNICRKLEINCSLEGNDIDLWHISTPNKVKDGTPALN